VGAALGAILLAQFNYEGGSSVQITYLMTVATMIFGTSLKLPFAALRRAMNYLGDISYPLYLLHYPVIYIANGIFGLRSQMVIIVLSIGTSVACHRYIEQPVTRWARA